MHNINLVKNSCGLDFGTSNSSIGFIQNNQPVLANFMGKEYIPSSIFFDFDQENPCFGNMAIEKYIDGTEGRIIWSPKNALGTGLILEKTQIRNELMSFKDIIALIIKNLKEQAQIQSQSEIFNVVIGRPVFFNDNDKDLDNLAQESMTEILMSIGFKNIEFEYEPIAAAIHYEQSIKKEELALIVDMGGGTSDFTVAKLEPFLNNKQIDRRKNILSVGGIHIAGTDFDKQLSLKALMPMLGLGANYKTLEGTYLSVPPSLYKDLATWHKIGFLYNNKNISYVKSKIYTSDAPEKFERLLMVLQKRLGHYLARLIEKTKISLSSNEKSLLFTNEIQPEIIKEITQKEFEKSIKEMVEKITNTILSTINTAQVSQNDINAIFMTGGSSLIPLVRKNIINLMPNATLIDGDKFRSVALGLTICAQEKFQC